MSEEEERELEQLQREIDALFDMRPISQRTKDSQLAYRKDWHERNHAKRLEWRRAYEQKRKEQRRANSL